MATITITMPHKTYMVRRFYDVHESVAEKVDKYINDLSKRERRKNIDDYFDWENEILNG